MTLEAVGEKDGSLDRGGGGGGGGDDGGCGNDGLNRDGKGSDIVDGVVAG